MNWIRSPWWDGFWILSGLPIGLLLVFVPPTWAIAILATIMTLESAHVVSPLILAWSHPSLRAIVRREWWRHVLLPPLVIAAAMLAPLQHVAGLYFAWNIYHFGMQNFGVAALYDPGRSVDARVRQGLACLAVTTAGMAFVPLLTRSPIALALCTGIFSFNHWLVDIGLSGRVSRRAWAFTAAVLVVGIIWLLLRQGPLSARTLPSIVAFRYGIGIVHFIYSARIWRLSDPQVRDAIGTSLLHKNSQRRSPRRALAAAVLLLCLLLIGPSAWANVVLSTKAAVGPGTTFLTTFTMVNDSGSTLPAGTPISFGQGFRYGDVMPGTHPIIRDATTHIALAGQQWDEISTWRENGGNGSWRHAVWGAWLPGSLAAGATYQVEILDTSGAYSETSHQALSVLCSGLAAHDLKIHLTDVRNQDNSVRDSGDATFRVCDNIANVGRDAPRHLRSGNVYDEYQVNGMFVYATSAHKDPLLYAQCDIDIFTQASNGTSPGDVRWVCHVHNSWMNVAAGSSGNAGNPGPVGFANDPQAISYATEIDDGASDVMDWNGLNATILSSNNPVSAVPTSNCDSSGGAYCMFVPSSLGANAWFYGQAVRASCSATCIGGVTNGALYYIWPTSSSFLRGPPNTQYVALSATPRATEGGALNILNGSQGTGSTTFSNRFQHWHWQAWETLDATGQDNWAPIGTTTRVTRKIYPAFTAAEKSYWQASGSIFPIYLSQPQLSIGTDYHQGESANYTPFGMLNVIGGGGVGARPDLGISGQFAAEAFLTGAQTDWDSARLFTLGSPQYGWSTLLDESTGRIPVINNGPPTGPGGNGAGGSYAGLGAPQNQVSWQPGGPFGAINADTNWPAPSSAYNLEFGFHGSDIGTDHMPSFDGFTYTVFGDRHFLDLMQWRGNADYLQNKIGPGPQLGMGYYRDNNATFTDGNIYHYYGLLTMCCQGRGSDWAIRDATYPAAFGGDSNIERSYFNDMITESGNYWPLFLKYKDGPGTTNYSTSIFPPANQEDPNVDVFINGYTAAVAYNMTAFLHAPLGNLWNSELQRFIEGTAGGQLAGMAPSTPGGMPTYYVAGFQIQPAIHNGDYALPGGPYSFQFGGNIGQYTNGTDATDFGWWSFDWLQILTGGTVQPKLGVPYLANGDTLKFLTPWYNGPNLDQIDGTVWYEAMNVNQGVSPPTFNIKCPLGHAVTSTCPTPGQAFTGFTRGGVPVTNEFDFEAPKMRFQFDPGPGQGYEDMNYAQYVGSIANGLSILGYTTVNAQSDFATRCGGTGLAQAFCYHQDTPNSWIDPTIVVPGVPPAVNGLPENVVPKINQVSGLPPSFIVQSGNAGTTIGTLVVQVTSGSFNGSPVLDTSTGCTGPDNALFAMTGNTLSVGASDILTARTYTLCVRATDPAYSNSPFFQSLSIVGAAPSSLLINGSNAPVALSSGSAITVSLTGGAGNPLDWLGVFAVGSPSNTSTLGSWEYLACDCQTPAPTKGVTFGTVHLSVPNIPGQYEVRYFLNDSFTVNRTSATITVGAGATTHYLTDPTGKALFLTGFHTWTNGLNWAALGPFSFNSYIDYAKTFNVNLIRYWDVWSENPDGAWHNNIGLLTTPLPFNRSGICCASDGGNKYDVTSFNQPHYDKIKSDVEYAGSKGMTVMVLLFMDNDFGGWSTHYWNGVNNINGTTTSSSVINTSTAAPTLGLQEGYVHKVLDTLATEPNVIYEIANEPTANAGGNGDLTASFPWQEAIIADLHSYEKAHGYTFHPVGAEYNVSQIGSTAADFVIPYEFNGNPEVFNLGKPVIVDTDHDFGIGGGTDWWWKAFMNGNNMLSMDDLHGVGLPGNLDLNNSTFTTLETQNRAAIAQTRTLTSTIADMTAVAPSGALSSTGYCLADTVGHVFLVYAGSGGSITLNLSSQANVALRAQWLSTADGSLSSITNITGGSASQALTSPFGATPAALIVHP